VSTRAASSRLGAAGLLLAFSAAALGGTSPASPFSLPAASQAELDGALAGTWVAVQPTLAADLQKEIQKLQGSVHGSLTIQTLALMSKDLSSPPRLVVTPTASGQQVEAFLPRGAWSFVLSGKVEYTVKVLFVTAHIGEDVTLAVTNLQATETLQLDTSNPTVPQCTQAGNLQLNYDLAVTTPSTILNVLLTLGKPLIDSLIQSALQNALKKIDAEIGLLVGQPPATPWGNGAPIPAPFSQQPDVQAASLAVDADIQSVQTPYGGIVTAYMSSPTYGQGTPLHYEGYGDSAIWTGHYLAGEAFRYAVTKDPAAQQNAARAIGAIEDMLDVEKVGGGHLARCVVPASAPDAATILSSPTAFTSTLNGQPVVCLGDVSRDQYLGVMHGLGCAYDLLDDPPTRDLAGTLIERMVDYLAANDWVAMQHDNVTMSADFIQSPDKMIAFTALAARVAPRRYELLRDEVGELAWVLWFFELTGVADPLSSYYKWNLGEGAEYHAMTLETNPSRYMALSRAHAIDRGAIGQDQSAYFQTIDTAIDPSLGATLAPQILDELRRFVARGRRDFTVTNSTDPTIAQGTYTAALSFTSTGTGTGSVGAVTRVEALDPIPVDKRPATDFLWQRDPFQLDGTGDPQTQEPGVDLVLPYWMARYYKLVP
jgi:hypothetical protein